MPDWVAVYKPYQSTRKVEVCTGVVLRKVPFPQSFLKATIFGTKNASGSREVATLSNFSGEAGATRMDEVIISPGIVLTPDCDIFQHKCNRVVVAQLVAVESHIHNQSFNAKQSASLRESLAKARAVNPGAFNHAGLFPLLGDETLSFGDHVVLLESLTSLPIEFPQDQASGMEVTEDSVGGMDNIWFNIWHPGLKARLISEYSRHMLVHRHNIVSSSAKTWYPPISR